MNILIWILIAILWLNAAFRATREMNELDGDAMEWITFPFIGKVVVIIFAPILMLVYERHILETKKKS